MSIVKVLTKTEMKEWYGDFYNHSANVSFDTDNVPSDLQALIPYAEFWAVSEDGDRMELFDAAPHDIQKNLHQVVRASNQELNKWLAGPASRSTVLTGAYIAFTQLRFAEDYYQEDSSRMPEDNCD